MTITFDLVDPDDSHARSALHRYLSEVASNIVEPRVGTHESDDVDDFRAPTGGFVVVRDDALVVGCGAVRTIGARTGEIKRMWIAPSHRGRGIGTTLLKELEGVSRTLGHDRVRLDTNSALVDAIGLYESQRYEPITRYNDNPDATNFYEKRFPK